MGYALSSFRDFQSCLKIVLGVDEDDIQLNLKHYFSHFMNYELAPGNYSNKDISEAIDSKKDHEGTLQIENDDISTKTKLFLSRFDGSFGSFGFDKMFLFNILGGFTQFWV